MKNFFRGMLAALAVAALTGCVRIETGEVGLRQNFDKTFSMTELQPGSLNQVLVGDVVTFKVQEVAAAIADAHPQAAENSSLDDFDAQLIYSLNPSSVAEIWTKESKSFHARDAHGDVLLMNGYLQTALKNAAYKVVREYPSLKLGDARAEIEGKIKVAVEESLKERGLANAIHLSQVQVTSMVPAAAIRQSATALVAAENALKQKAVEVETAKKEAERISALNANSKAIDYMNAQANMLIAEGIQAGKVHTVVVPYDFKGIVNVK